MAYDLFFCLSRDSRHYGITPASTRAEHKAFKMKKPERAMKEMRLRDFDFYFCFSYDFEYSPHGQSVRLHDLAFAGV
jgi:hypothetical protein